MLQCFDMAEPSTRVGTGPDRNKQQEHLLHVHFELSVLILFCLFVKMTVSRNSKFSIMSVRDNKKMFYVSFRQVFPKTKIPLETSVHSRVPIFCCFHISYLILKQKCNSTSIAGQNAAAESIVLILNSVQRQIYIFSVLRGSFEPI